MIKVSDLKKNYALGEREHVVLNGISFSVKKGEFVCIVGSSGAGKSTLLRCIVGTDQDYKGSILIDGKKQKEYTYNKSIAFVSQEYSNFPWLTVQENVHLGNPNANLSSVQGALKRLGIDNVRDYFPSQLSGGMRQRVAIARALIQGTEIILLDEPFGALDIHTRSQTQQLLLKLWKEDEKTIIFVTHDIDEAILLADRVLVLSSYTGTIQEEIPIKLSRPRFSDMQFANDFIKIKKP